MTEYEKFKTECTTEIALMSRNKKSLDATKKWMDHATESKYSYHFEWAGRPIIQYPQDIVAFQEVVLQTKPDLIIETGIAHGGSLCLSASLLALLDYMEAVESSTILDPKKPKRKVLGIDIDIRKHNREAIEAHPLSNRIQMIQGSSIALNIVEQVKKLAKNYNRVMVSLDSNHTHEHVLAELEAYAPLTTIGCYCVVFDTVVEDLPADLIVDRPWGKGNNPKTAVWEYLKNHKEFVIDKEIQDKLQITVAPDGWLRRV